MKHGFSFAPGSDPEHMKLDYFAEFCWDDRRSIGDPGILKVDFSSIDLRSIPIQLSTEEGLEYTSDRLTRSEEIHLPGLRGGTTRFSLSEKFAFTTFDVRQFRQAYVLVRRIAHAVEDAMCLQAALAPCYGIVQTFDVSVAVPKEVLNFEPFRRSILLRRT